MTSPGTGWPELAATIRAESDSAETTRLEVHKETLRNAKLHISNKYQTVGDGNITGNAQYAEKYTHMGKYIEVWAVPIGHILKYG